jgi:hypothetical protein
MMSIARDYSIDLTLVQAPVPSTVGLIAKPIAPKVSLGTLMAASLFPDLLWSIFLITEIEHARIKPGITVVNPLDLFDAAHATADRLRVMSSSSRTCSWPCSPSGALCRLTSIE